MVAPTFLDIVNELEPITRENIYQLEEGEWIWDNDTIFRREHRQTLHTKEIADRIGFRQIHILDLKRYPRWSSKPFMLSSIDKGCNEWTYFEEGRFFMFKRREN